MMEATTYQTRCTFNPFSLDGDVNPKTGKKGIRYYKNPAAILFQKILRNVVLIPTTNGKICVNKNSLRNWLNYHGVASNRIGSRLDFQRVIFEVVLEADDGLPYKIKKPLKPLLYRGNLLSNEELKNWINQERVRNTEDWDSEFQETAKTFANILDGQVSINDPLLQDFRLALTLMKSHERSTVMTLEDLFNCYTLGEIVFRQRLQHIQQIFLSYQQNFEWQLLVALSDFKLGALEALSNDDDEIESSVMNRNLKALGKKYGIPGYELACTDESAEAIIGTEAKASLEEKYLQIFKHNFFEGMASWINLSRECGPAFKQWLELNHEFFEMESFGYFSSEKENDQEYLETNDMSELQRNGTDPFVSREEAIQILNFLKLGLPTAQD